MLVEPEFSSSDHSPSRSWQGAPSKPFCPRCSHPDWQPLSLAPDYSCLTRVLQLRGGHPPHPCWGPSPPLTEAGRGPRQGSQHIPSSVAHHSSRGRVAARALPPGALHWGCAQCEQPPEKAEMQKPVGIKGSKCPAGSRGWDRGSGIGRGPDGWEA